MARFCTVCGSELRDGVAFCTECGAKAEQPAKAQPPVSQSVPQNAPQPAVQSPPAAENPNKVVGTAAYFGMMLLFALPVIGWIACIIMSFAPKNQNIKHFARANLIWLLIAALLVGLVYLAVSALIDLAMPYFEQFQAGEFGEFGEYADLIEQFSDLKDLIEKYQNMIPETVPIE